MPRSTRWQRQGIGSNANYWDKNATAQLAGVSKIIRAAIEAAFVYAAIGRDDGKRRSVYINPASSRSKWVTSAARRKRADSSGGVGLM